MSESTELIIGLAKRAARAEKSRQLMVRHFLMGALLDPSARAHLRNKCNQGDEINVPASWRAVLDKVSGLPEVEEKILLGPGFKEVFQNLYSINNSIPPLATLIMDLLRLPDPAVKEFTDANPEFNVDLCEAAPEHPRTRLGKLMDEISALQNTLSRKVIGQGSAIQEIGDALFAARLYHREGNKTPRSALVFLGPPGVGKTYTAELIAQSLCAGEAQAFLRLDMAAYADPNSMRVLVGFAPSFSEARTGLLTGHVADHPEAVILVDQVEKAHTTVQNLFLQILDRGVLEDKFHKRDVSFGGTVIIFTTNLGKSLYSGPARSGILARQQASRPAVLEALRSSTDPLTGAPIVSPELSSRLAKGFPVMFNHLAPGRLEEIARLAIQELDLEFNRQLGIRVTEPDERLVALMVMRLGPDLDARTLSSGVPLLIKDAFKDVLVKHKEELMGREDAFDRIRALEVGLPRGPGRELIEELYKGGSRAMLITGRTLEDTGLARFQQFEWTVEKSSRQAVECLVRSRSDFVLLDFDLHHDQEQGEGAGSARSLRRLRTAFPDLPVYLFVSRDKISPSETGLAERVSASGGARGFLPGHPSTWPDDESSPLEKIRTSILRERWLREKFRTRKTINFEWESEIRFEDKEGTIIIRPHDLHETTVVASRDRAARLTFTGIPSERFDQVAGAREAKRRLREVINWMRNPDALRSLGVDLPTGILLEGPPGGGKTMLARATAGEAGMPFFAANATDFASKWVGESERNVRELFERAASYAPSILFIDEIDSIGSRRASETTGVTEQILTQLLVSMDGFTRKERPVFFLAATNRADLLDPALKRPGRFDYMITIGDLDVEGREELLRLKTEQVPLDHDVDLSVLARSSWGLTGARLTQVAKEAAVLAFREAPPGAGPGEIRVSMRHFEEALTNVRYGLREEGVRLSEEDLKITAFHEAAHALISELECPGSVRQVTVLPRGRALGFMEALPEKENHAWTAGELLSRIRVALAGRCAESMVFGKNNISSGCGRDLETATRLAAMAVTRLGMSDDLGPVSVDELERLLPRSSASERAAKEIERIVREQEEAVNKVLQKYKPVLEETARKLMEHETLDGSYISQMSTQIKENPGGS